MEVLSEVSVFHFLADRRVTAACLLSPSDLLFSENRTAFQINSPIPQFLAEAVFPIKFVLEGLKHNLPQSCSSYNLLNRKCVGLLCIFVLYLFVE